MNLTEKALHISENAEIFGFPINTYVYVDKLNANSGSAEWRGKHYDEYVKMKPNEEKREEVKSSSVAGASSV